MKTSHRARSRVATIVIGSLIACASPGLPPGGPPDSAAPTIRRISPDSNATNVRAKAILIHFDEVISERPTGQGGVGAAAGLGGLVLVSPTNGRDRVNWRRTAIEIAPRGGFRPNTAYRVTLLPGVTDLRGNVVNEPVEFVFSTGANIPTGTIRGVVFDWAAGRVVPRARVEVFAGADSSVRWIAQADSVGRFVVRDLAPDSYTVRAWLDANNDRLFDQRELFDRATIALTDSGRVDLYAFARDTLSPRIEQIEPMDSTALRVRFDRAVAADWIPDASLSLLGADSAETRIAIGAMLPAVRFDSLARVGRDSARTDTTAADSVRAEVVVTDTTVFVTTLRDTTFRDTTFKDSTVRRMVPVDSVSADTLTAPTAVPAPVFGRALPVQLWVIALDSALAPGSYLLRVRGVRGLSGRSGDTERAFRVREPTPPRPGADSTAVPRPVPDSLARPQPATDSTVPQRPAFFRRTR